MSEPKDTPAHGASRVRKNMDMDAAKLAAAQRVLGARTETETVDRALDYVVFQGLTVGGSVMLSTRGLSVSGNGPKTLAPATANDDGLTLFGTARVGYAYAFDSTFALWPRLGLAYASSTSRGEIIDPTTSKSLGSYETKSHLGTLNIEALFAVSPIEHIVVTGGPYLDLGLGGGYTLLQESTEMDSRDARLTSYGLIFNAAGYY